MSPLEFLRGQPVFTLFLVLGLGHMLGRLRIGTVTLGPVAGVLFVGLVFGHLGFTMSPGAQAVGFALFIFSVGYQAGPRFFDVLRADGLKYLLIALVVTVTGVTLAVLLSRAFGLEPGTGAGVLSGGLTSSPTLAAAQEAMRGDSISPPAGWTSDQVVGNITTGYAITYIFGLAGLILIVKVMPRLLGIDLAQEAQRLEKAAAPDEAAEAPSPVVFRAFRVTSEELLGKSAVELRALWDGLSWIRLCRGGRPIETLTGQALERGDELLVLGSPEYLSGLPEIGEDVSYRHLAGDASAGGFDRARVRVQSSDVVGRTLADLDAARRFGVFVAKVLRMREPLPRDTSVELRRDDLLEVVGPEANVKALAEAVGEIEGESEVTNLLTLAIGIAVGVLLGTFSVTIGKASVSLGSAGGLLVTGITIGFLHGLRPSFGRFSGGARWFLREFGLQLFMIGVGLRAGADIVETFAQAGPQLISAGIVVTVVPLLTAYVVGRRLLHLNPAILFGAITGAMTSGAALSVVTGEAKSEVPALGYTGTYAFSNVFLTVAGPLMIVLA